MKHLLFTYIDQQFGTVRAETPGEMFNASMPDVEWLEFKFALESRYPEEIFYGTCPDDVEIDRPGVVREITEQEFDEAFAVEMRSRKGVPDEVTAAQAQVALYDAGLLDQVEGLLMNHPYPKVRIWWRAARNWVRSNPYIYAFALELDLSEEQVDDLFIAAKKVVE